MDSEVPTPPRTARVPKRSPYRSVLRLRNFRRLWIGTTCSSLGDWIGLFALLSVTTRLAPHNTLAVAGLMVFRMVPALVIGPLAGVALDRWDRRKAMVLSDVARAALIITVPFVRTLPVLYAIMFALETIALVWTPAKDALVPSLVPSRWLVAANSLSLSTTYGLFPLGAFLFTLLVGAAEFFSQHVVRSIGPLPLDQENLALLLDAVTFLLSATFAALLSLPPMEREKRPIRVKAIFSEMLDGLRYVRRRGPISRLLRSIGFALAGGAVVFSLGAPYVTDVLRGGAKGFGLMVSVLGTGMGLGVLLLGFISDRLPKPWVFASGILGGGLALVGLAAVSAIGTALAAVAVLGAFAGIAMATGFAMLQEQVAEEVRGRTFASVQVVIRVSFFASLVAFPALARLGTTLLGTPAEGIRFSLALGGLIAIVAGTLAARDVASRKL